MDWVQTGLLVAGLLLAARVLPVIVTWRKLCALPFLRDRSRLLPQGEAPREFVSIVNHATGALRSVGFEFSHLETVEAEAQPAATREYHAYFANPSRRAVALVKRTEMPGLSAGYDVAFATFFEDGGAAVTTCNSTEAFFPSQPNRSCRDAGPCHLDMHWASHLRHVGDVMKGRQAIQLSPDEMLVASQTLRDELFRFWVTSGFLVPAGVSGHFRVNARAAYALARRLRSMTGSLPATQRPPILAPAARDADVGAHVLFYERVREQERMMAERRGAPWLVFAVSIVLFAAAFGLRLDLRQVLILTGVVLFHELGHLVAMRAFGYRNTRILFLPFLGAVATGRKDVVKPWQEFIVYLAGPLPGIVAGAACAIAALLFPVPPLVGEIALWALIINYLNMLPFLPFDGGRMIDSALLVRYPRARFLFTVISVAFLGFAYAGTGDVIFLILAIIFAMSLPSEWRFAKAARALEGMRDRLVDARERLHAIFCIIASGSFANIALPARMMIAKRLDHQFAAATPTTTLSVVGVLTYVGVWIAPVIGVVGAGFGAGLVWALGIKEPNYDLMMTRAGLPEAAHAQRGQVHVSPSDLTEAIDTAMRVVVAAKGGDPANATPYVRALSAILARAGRIEEAEDVLLGELEDVPASFSAARTGLFTDLGWLDVQRKRYDIAQVHFQAAVDALAAVTADDAVNPSPVEPMIDLSYVDLISGRGDAARRRLEKAQKEYPEAFEFLVDTYVSASRTAVEQGGNTTFWSARVNARIAALKNLGFIDANRGPRLVTDQLSPPLAKM